MSMDRRTFLKSSALTLGALATNGFFQLIFQLVETKAKYDQFFKKKPYVFIFPSFKGVSNALKQAKRQEDTIKRHLPTSLAWYFKSPLFHARMTEEFAKSGLSILTIFKQ